MSIVDRLNDARLLFGQGRRDGALLSVLVAVAATSRKRYPRSRFSDEQAFIRFLLDEHPVVVGNSDWVPTCEDDYIRCIDPRKALDSDGNRVGGWWFGVPGSEWPDELMPLATCLYKYVRNNLAHEGTLPDNVDFVESEHGALTFEVLEDHLRISNSIMDGLSRAVTFAPENGDLFPDIAETPPDVIAWMLFRKARDQRKVYLEQRAERIRHLGTSRVQRLASRHQTNPIAAPPFRRWPSRTRPSALLQLDLSHVS